MILLDMVLLPRGHQPSGLKFVLERFKLLSTPFNLAHLDHGKAESTRAFTKRKTALGSKLPELPTQSHLMRRVDSFLYLP